VLISTICAFLILPFVFVDVSISSPGVIRTLSEKTEIKSLVSGRISKMAVVENQIVNTGDVLFAIATEELDNKIRLSVFDEKENFIKLHDLQTLCNLKNLFTIHFTNIPNDLIAYPINSTWHQLFLPANSSSSVFFNC
jgi:membrane fusion protein, peptide pheromone/bacteriocin exporter